MTGLLKMKFDKDMEFNVLFCHIALNTMKYKNLTLILYSVLLFHKLTQQNGNPEDLTIRNMRSGLIVKAGHQLVVCRHWKARERMKI